MPYPESPPRRGEIYWVDFSPARGSEQAGRRPAVVISLDSFNSHMPVVVVAAITTKISLSASPWIFLKGSLWRKISQILAFQVTTIDQSRLDGYLGALDAQQVAGLKNALRTAWGIQ